MVGVGGDPDIPPAVDGAQEVIDGVEGAGALELRHRQLDRVVGRAPVDDPYLSVGDLLLRPIDPPAYRDLGVIWRAETELAPPTEALRRRIMAYAREECGERGE